MILKDNLAMLVRDSLVVGGPPIKSRSPPAIVVQYDPQFEKPNTKMVHVKAI